MPLITIAWVNRRRTIEAICDLDNGWHRLQYGYGYSEQEFLDFPGDYRIRFHVTVAPRPWGFTDSRKQFPLDATSKGGDDLKNYLVSRGRLTINILVGNADSVSLHLPWFITANDKLAFDWVEWQILPGAALSYEMRVLAVFQPPPGREPPTVRDWERRFFPGGLPGLGKRR